MGFDCPTCDRTLQTQRGMRQHHTKVHGDPLPNRTCKGCETEFYDEKARRVFCDNCNPNAGENNGNWRDARESAECRRCGSKFRYYPSDKAGVFCPECVAEADEFLGTHYAEVHGIEPVEFDCEQCGATRTYRRATSEMDEDGSVRTSASPSGCPRTGGEKPTTPGREDTNSGGTVVTGGG